MGVSLDRPSEKDRKRYTGQVRWQAIKRGANTSKRARQVSCTRHLATSSLLAFLIAAIYQITNLRDFHMAMGHSQGQTCQNPGTLMNPGIPEITGKWRLCYSRIQYQGEKCKNPARSRSVSSPHGLTKANSAGAISHTKRNNEGFGKTFKAEKWLDKDG